MRHPSTQARPGLDKLDRVIINRLQDGLPLEPAPFAVIAAEFGCTEAEVIARTRQLRSNGVLTRVGPFLDAAAMGGAFCLCAMAVPRSRFDEVAEIVNSYPEVAHNYEREHELSMWFVLATETPDAIAATAARIEQATGLPVLSFPKLEEFFIGFRAAA